MEIDVSILQAPYGVSEGLNRNDKKLIKIFSFFQFFVNLSKNLAFY